MDKSKKIICMVILSFAVLQSYGVAQDINLSMVRGARNAAMADALISESHDVSVIYLNPASLSFIKDRSLFFNHGQLRKNLGMTENFAMPVVHLTGLAISFGLDSYHYGFLNKNKSLPDQNVFEYGFNLSAATNAFAETFSIGASFGLRYGQAKHSNDWAAFYSVGINYSPSSDINYGLVLSGVGDELKYLKEDTLIIIDKHTAPKRLVLGASMKYPSSSSLRRTVFILALANEKIFGTDGLLYKIGMEVRPWQFLGLRFGYVLGPDVSEPRIGLGFSFSSLQFEYAIYTGPSPAMFQQLSLSIKI